VALLLLGVGRLLAAVVPAHEAEGDHDQTGEDEDAWSLGGTGYAISVDCGGDSSTATATFTGFQEGAASYSKTWHRTSFAGGWGGTAKYTAAASASATFHCSSCRAIAWVTDEDSAHGSAKVYVDGALKAIVNTRSSSALNRVLAYTFEWASDGAHALKITNVATSGHPRATVDGFLTRS